MSIFNEKDNKQYYHDTRISMPFKLGRMACRHCVLIVHQWTKAVSSYHYAVICKQTTNTSFNDPESVG
jgi:hypothetical protein